MESFSERLKRLRLEKKMSLEEVGQAIGKTGKSIRSLVSNWENDRGQPSMADLVRISALFGVTLDELISGKVSAVTEAPAGYVLMPAQEVIDMQRRLIKQQEAEINRKK